MDRYWFFTWRTYGTWLPGEEGSVGPYLTPDGRRVIDNTPGRQTASAMPGLSRYAQSILTHPPVQLTPPQCGVVENEVLRTCQYRGWKPDALAVMSDHVHLLFGVNDDPDPNNMLAELKAYCSRVLNKPQPRPKGWWWSDGGSTRKVKADDGLANVAEYIRDQPDAVRVWLNDETLWLLAKRDENLNTHGPCGPGSPRYA